MNVKKMYYLSERIYETMNCEEKQSEARKEYWRNLWEKQCSIRCIERTSTFMDM